MSVKLRFLYRALRYRLHVDPAELQFVCSQLRPGQIAADIGCHKGAYAYWMRRRVGPQGSVYAFEPQPQQVAYLRRAFVAMRYNNVEIVPMAVSNRCGELILHYPDGADHTHAASLETHYAHDATMSGHAPVSTACPTSISVQGITLDAFFADREPPDFLKIDVEGHELAVLEGARDTLARNRPTLLIECEARHRSDGSVFAVFERLEALGYEGSFFRKGHRYSLAEFDVQEHQRIDPHKNIPLGEYVNNFAFVHEQAAR